MKNLRLHGIEHFCFCLKSSKGFLCVWVAAWNNNGYIFPVVFPLRVISSHFSSLEIKTLLLSSLTKPVSKQPCSLGLLFTCCTTHIKQNVRIHTKKLPDDAKNSLPYLFVIGRGNVVKVVQIKPICLKVWMIFFVEIYRISASIVCFEIKDITSIPHLVWRKDIYECYFKGVHGLNKFQVIGVLYLSFFLHSFFFIIHSSNLSLFCCNASLCTIEPFSDFFRRAVCKSRRLCIHNDNTLINSAAKIKIKTETTK